MKNIIREFSSFFYNPYKWTIKIIENENQKIFLITTIIVLLCSLSNYIALFKSIVGSSYLPIVIGNAILFIIIFSIIFFIDVAITNLFTKKNNSSKLTNSKIYLIIASSYYPYIFLSIVSNINMNISIYILLSCLSVIASIIIRKKIIKYFQSHFNQSALIVAITPFVTQIIIHISLIALTIGLISSFFMSKLINIFQGNSYILNLLNNIN